MVGVGRPRSRRRPSRSRRSQRCGPSSVRTTGSSPCRRWSRSTLPGAGPREEGARPPRGGGRRAVGEGRPRSRVVTHAAGKSYPDLLEMRSGVARAALRTRSSIPADAGEVRAVLDVCADERGRGRAVRRRHERRRRGGAAARRPRGRDQPRPRPHRPRARRRQALADGRARSRACAVPRSSPALAAHGLTLGHYPQSWEYATVGGWVATRSAGQASTGYGAIDKVVSGLRCVAPAGDIALAPIPATRRGPGPAPAAGRLGGTVRRDHRGHAEGAAAARERSATRAGCSTTSRRGPRRSARSSSAM